MDVCVNKSAAGLLVIEFLRLILYITSNHRMRRMRCVNVLIKTIIT